MKARSLAERRAEDLETRRHAQREFQRPLVVEAGAGTGKTATLVARIVAWCLGPGWQRALDERPEAPPRRLAARVLEGVVAITFTEAAAAEMAARVESTLRGLEFDEASASVELPASLSEGELRSRAQALRGSVDHLVVQTIHAWCRRLLSAHPVEAGLPPRFEVDADGRRHRGLVRELLEERLREAYAQPDGSPLLDLAVAGVGPGELEDALLGLLAAGVDAENFALDPLSPERIGAEMRLLTERVEAFAGSGIAAFHAGKQVPKAKELLDATEALETRLARVPADLEALAELLDWLSASFDKTLVDRLRNFAREAFGKNEAKALAGAESRVAGSAGPLHELLSNWVGLDVRLLAAQHAALAPLLAEVQARARLRGFCSYEELLGGCARLLAENSRVAAQVRGELDQLLVDEFQDTDARQCEIVASLALEGPREERPGLFVVGDPKQSIYGWRSADLAAYEAFVARVVDAGGESRRLCVNHRSVPAVLEEVERSVAPAMHPVPRLQPAFESLVVSEANAGEAGFCQADFAPVEHWLPVHGPPGDREPAKTLARDAARIEARALARDLLRLRDECGVSWRDVGVLFRSRGDWEIYLQEFRRAGVLFNVEGDRNYFRRREIIDAVAWLRCVVDPGDELALVTLLRSPAVGVPDAALQPLFAAGLPTRVRALEGVEPVLPEALRDLIREVAEDLPEAVPGLKRIAAWPLNLEAALFQLGRLRASLLEDPGDVFVEKLRAYSLLEASEAGRFLGSWRVANLERFFAELAVRFAAGAPLQEILRDLQEGVSSEEKREEARLRDLVPDAVRVMTLHGAKGLAFDHVYLMQLQKGSRPRGDGVASRWLDGQLEFHLGGTRTLGWARAHAAREAVSDAERARLLYVGSTRARKRLVLSGLPTTGGGGAAKDSLSALLDARNPERPDLAKVLRACQAAGSDRSELAEALYVVPALREDFEAAHRSGQRVTLPDAARIQADAAALREAQRAAAERMRRPLAATVSRSVEALRDGPATGVPALSAESARAGGVGSAVHSVLEALDLSLPPESALAHARAGLAAQLPRWFVAGQLEAGRQEVEDLLEEISKGALFARLFELGECVLARELPLLLRPGPEDVALGYVSGSIDLLYRDPQDGEWVVADYKTDRAPDDAALKVRGDHHAAQGRYYVRALREAFALPADPRFELWFLRHDRCWVPALSSP